MSQKLEEKPRRKSVQPLGSTPDYRWNAVPSSDRVTVLAGAACWENPGDADPSARLAVTVRVTEAQEHTRAWLDVYAFDREGGLVCFDTHDLQYAEPAEGGGLVYALDEPVWGPGRNPSSAPGPAPRRLKYRVYVRPDAGLFTDGLLHDLPLPEPKGKRRVPTMPPSRSGRTKN